MTVVWSRRRLLALMAIGVAVLSLGHGAADVLLGVGKLLFTSRR